MKGAVTDRFFEVWSSALTDSGGSFFQEGKNCSLIAARGPDGPEEVCGMDVVLFQESAISTAAVHDLVAESALEEALSLPDDAG